MFSNPVAGLHMVRVGILGEPGSLGLLRSEVALLLLGQLEEPYRRFSVGLCDKHNTTTLLWYCKHLVHATRGAASSILRLADRDLQDKGRINGAAIGIGHSPQSPWRTLSLPAVLGCSYICSPTPIDILIPIRSGLES